MIVRLFFLLIILLSLRFESIAQQELNFSVQWKKAILALGDTIEIGGHPLTVETFRFYVSHIKFRKAGTTIYADSPGYHLIDLSTPPTCKIAFPKVAAGADEISFLLGTDSIANVSGAMGGDLDPINGMYWAWQSGYINIKIEGYSPLSPDHGHEYHYHLGGYAGKNATAHLVDLNVSPSKSINICLDIEKILTGIDLSKKYNIMIPGLPAVEMSEKVSKCFFVAP